MYASSTVLAQDHFYSDLCCLPSTCQTQASSMEMSLWQRHVEGNCFKQVDDNWRCQFLNGCLSILLMPTFGYNAECLLNKCIGFGLS